MSKEPPSADAEPTDEALMAEIAAGRQEAVGLLYPRYAPRIFAMAVQVLDRPTAEEVVQDVFVSVWRKASTFDPARGPATYLTHPDFITEVEARARVWGGTIGVRYGEGYRVRGPVPVSDARVLIGAEVER